MLDSKKTTMKMTFFATGTTVFDEITIVKYSDNMLYFGLKSLEPLPTDLMTNRERQKKFKEKIDDDGYSKLTDEKIILIGKEFNGFALPSISPLITYTLRLRRLSQDELKIMFGKNVLIFGSNCYVVVNIFKMTYSFITPATIIIFLQQQQRKIEFDQDSNDLCTKLKNGNRWTLMSLRRNLKSEKLVNVIQLYFHRLIIDNFALAFKTIFLNHETVLYFESIEEISNFIEKNTSLSMNSRRVIQF